MSFHERFDIQIGLDEARKRFVNRVYNRVVLDFILGLRSDDTPYGLYKAIATRLGDKYSHSGSIDHLIGSDFYRNLQAIEAIHDYFSTDSPGIYGSGEVYRKQITAIVRELLSQSEVDLGIEWLNGCFVRKGAVLLDNELVNAPLRWLRENGFKAVLGPFEKGLSDFLHSHNKKSALTDVITDMYEALEALAKKVTGRDKEDLSGNREAFISKVKASAHYKVLLKDYIDYANYLRHAERDGKPKPQLTEREVESFVYMTGIFIRLAMPQAATATTSSN